MEPYHPHSLLLRILLVPKVVFKYTEHEIILFTHVLISLYKSWRHTSQNNNDTLTRRSNVIPFVSG